MKSDHIAVTALLLPFFALFGYGGPSYATTTSSTAPASIWVAYNSFSNNGTVAKINGSTGTVSRAITVGHSPDAIVVDSSGNVWVANFGSDTVSEIIGSTGTVRTIAVGTNPRAMAVDPSGNVWVANHASGSCNGNVCFTISEINGATGTVSRTITVGEAPQAIAADSSGNIWVASGAGIDNSYLHIQGKVLEINGAAGTVSRTIAVGYSPDAIAVDSFGHVWVADYFSDTISEINGSTGAVSRTVKVGRLPQAIAADSSGNVWVTNSGGNTLSEINGSTGAVSRTIATAPGGQNQLAIAVGPADNRGVSSGTTANVLGHTYAGPLPTGGSICWAFHKDGTVMVSQSKDDQRATGTYSVANKNISVTIPGAFDSRVLQIDSKGCIYSAQQPAEQRLCRVESGTTPCKVPGQARIATHGAKPTGPLDKAREAAQDQEKAAAIAAEKRKATLKLVPKF